MIAAHSTNVSRARRITRAGQIFLIGISGCLGLLLTRPGLASASTSVAETLQQVQESIQRGDLAGARSQLTKALKEFPEEAGFVNLLGVVEAQQGNYRAAESNFKKAIEKAPHFTGATLNLGRLYQENIGTDPEALQKSLDTYERLLRFEPRNAEANYQTALLLGRQGSFRESLEHLSRLSTAGQERPQALALRCADYAALGERSRADAEAIRLLASPGLTEADILPILPTLEKHQRDDLGVRLLEGLVERKLASLSAFDQLSLLYERRGQLDRARSTLEKEAEGKPNSVSLLVELAHVANQQRDYNGALGYLAHARDLEPQNAGVHFFFGMVCVELDLAQEAYNSLKKAVSLDPSNPYYNYALGAVAAQRDDPREALPYFRKYCELQPQDPRGRFALGAAYYYSHDYELARKELEGVAKVRETAAGAHYFLGRLANQEGNLPEAVRELHEALEVNPNNADAYAELGHVHIKQKDYALAEKALRRALEIDSNNYTANLNLMVLYQRTGDQRAGAQAQRFEEIRKKRSERAKEFLRTIEVRP